MIVGGKAGIRTGPSGVRSALASELLIDHAVISVECDELFVVDNNQDSIYRVANS